MFVLPKKEARLPSTFTLTKTKRHPMKEQIYALMASLVKAYSMIFPFVVRKFSFMSVVVVGLAYMERM